MCSERILVRLRLTENGRQEQKQSILGVIKKAIPPLQQLRTRQLKRLRDVVDLTLARMKSVTRLGDAWTKHQTAGSLKSLVVGMHDLWQVEQLRTILEAIPNREVDPSSRTNLLNTIKKVARYCEAAQMLCRIAKKYPMVHNMTVVPVELPEQAFDRSIPKDPPTLDSVLKRFQILRKQANIGKLYRILQVPKDKANSLFSEQLSKTLAEAKIHAEIQIVFHYELNRTLKPPRIVRSSKSACFLCNTFISMYKEIYTPRCHGRLYSAWRLPQLSAFMGLQTTLNGVLEQLIDRSLRTMLSTGKKIMYPFPNESSLCSLPMSASTSIPASSTSTEQIESKHEQNEEIENGHIVDDSIMHEQVEGRQAESQAVPTSDPLLTEYCGPKASSDISDDKPENIVDLLRGVTELPESVSKNAAVNSSQLTVSSVSEQSEIDLVENLEVLQKLKHHGSSRLYKAGPLEVLLECTSEPSQPSRSGTSLSNTPIKIKWLSQKELEACHEDKDFEIIDADSLSNGTDVGIQGRDIIYIAARGSVLRIEFCRQP